jgi:hypothetical protein
MSDDERTAREARANKLRERIERVKNDEAPSDGSSEPESAREFIERRMHELDADEDDLED